MEWIETTGATVEAALDVALDMLGVHEDEVEFEVVEEPKSGFLGRFGGSDARLRVRLKPVSREKPNDRRRRKQGRNRDGGARNRKTEPRRPANGQQREKPRNDESEKKMNEETISVEDQATAATEFAAGLVEAYGFSAEVTNEIDEDIINIHIDGDDLGLMVGPKGATLQAVEEIVRAVVQRESGGHGARVYVDVGGYRAKRRAALAAFTEKLVAQVIDTGKELPLEPMGASDRKVVHDTVSEIDGVKTSSEGEDPRRHVVIRPA